MELVDFAPNQFVYRVRARAATSLVFPLRMRVGVDEWKVTGLRPGSRNGKLAIDVPPGEHELVMTYRPRFLMAGAATSTATAIALVFILWLRD